MLQVQLEQVAWTFEGVEQEGPGVGVSMVVSRGSSAAMIVTRETKQLSGVHHGYGQPKMLKKSG